MSFAITASKKMTAIQKITYFGLPFGRIATNVKFSQDSQTRSTLKKLTENAKHRGLIILDAHPGLMDIISIAAGLLKQGIVSSVMGPVAACFYYHPGLRRPLFSKLTKESFELLPVFRKEEMNYTKRHFKDFSGTNHEEKRQINGRYIVAAQKAKLKPGSAVVFAPYGGERITKRWLRKGVFQVITPTDPLVCAISRFDLAKCQYTIFLSDVFFLRQDQLTVEGAHQVFVRKYTILQACCKRNYSLFQERHRFIKDKLVELATQHLFKVPPTPN